MNIAGPEKSNGLITAGFHLGLNILDAHLQADRIPVLQKNIYEEATGCEGFYVLDVDAAMAVQIEDFSAVGRLFDMDVLTPKGQKVSWENLWLPGRTCLICRGPVHICSRSRAHSLEALQEKTRSLLQEAIWQQKAAMTAGITKLEFVGNEQTVGEKLYAVHGITGTRGQAEAGFPALTEVGLSKLEEGLSRGLTLGEDPFPCQETLEKLDVDFIEKNLAPGGSADLLAATYFLHFLKTSL